MELIYVSISFFTILFVVITILNLNKKTKPQIESINKESTFIKKTESELKEVERFYWYVLANLIFEDKMYGFVVRYLNDKSKIESNNIDYYLMENYIKSVLKNKLINENDNDKLIFWVLTYHKTKSLESLKAYRAEEYVKFLKEFDDFINQQLVMDKMGDLEFFKKKITDVQPERENELILFIKKQKIKYMFSTK